MKYPGKVSAEQRGSATKEDDPQQKGKLKTYCQLVNYLLITYATDDVIEDVEAEITNFEQPEGMFAVRYLELLWKMLSRCDCVR